MFLRLKIKRDFCLCPVGKRNAAVSCEKFSYNVAEHFRFRLLCDVVLMNPVVEVFQDVILDTVSKAISNKDFFQVPLLVIRRPSGVDHRHDRSLLMNVVDRLAYPLQLIKSVAVGVMRFI